VREQSSVWNKYRGSVRQFDAVLEHAKAVSSSLVGRQPPNANASYGEQVFVAILTHCVTLRRLAPDSNRQIPNELWDLPSMCAIARCAIEAHDSFLYIAGTAVPSKERDFRISLWEFHDKTRRLKMLESLGSKNPEIDKIRGECPPLLQKIKTHPTFQTIAPAVQRRVMEGNPPAFHLSQKERCQSDGFDFDYHHTVTMQLSQYVHTFPFALHQLFSFRAGSNDALHLMSLPLEFVLPFLGRVTNEMRAILQQETPDPPARTARTMAIWDAIYRRGVKNGDPSLT
jgi:hypothetical protein